MPFVSEPACSTVVLADELVINSNALMQADARDMDASSESSTDVTQVMKCSLMRHGTPSSLRPSIKSLVSVRGEWMYPGRPFRKVSIFSSSSFCRSHRIAYRSSTDALFLVFFMRVLARSTWILLMSLEPFWVSYTLEVRCRSRIRGTRLE